MLAFWIAANAAFAIVIEAYGSLTPKTASGKHRINDGSMTFLQGFAIYLASLVVFRLFFAILHIIKFKCRACCVDKYKTYVFDMQEEFANMRAQTKNWDESVLDRTDLQLLNDQQEDEKLPPAVSEGLRDD